MLADTFAAAYAPANVARTHPLLHDAPAKSQPVAATILLDDAPSLERETDAVGGNNAGAAGVDDIVGRCGGSAFWRIRATPIPAKNLTEIALQSGGCVAIGRVTPGRTRRLNDANCPKSKWRVGVEA